MTSAENFPDEPRVPPVVLDTGDLSVGTIITYDKNKGGDLRLGIRVRDENLDEVLDVRARLSVLNEDYEYLCPTNNIAANGQPQRELFELILDPTKLRQGVCTRVEIFVSSDYRKTCDAPIEAGTFGLSREDDDGTRAVYWIWEMSGNPAQNPGAAQSLVTSCQTLARAQSTQLQMDR